MLASSVEKPLIVESRTLKNLGSLKPVNDATVCLQMSVLSSRPTFILASLDGSSDSLARVQVKYLNDFEACDVCHRTSHDIMDCEHMTNI